MKRILYSVAAAALTVALAGCGAAPQGTEETPRLTTVPTPSSPSSASPQPLASGIVDTVFVTVYAGTPFKATRGCGCKATPTASQEMFPAGTPVMLLKIGLTGVWKPSQGSTTSQDVTGMKLTGTKFDGRPEQAVLDSSDGRKKAQALRLPWLPQGLFGNARDWQIPNKQTRFFSAAWYVPAGVDRLLLTVDIPSEGQPNHLIVNLPPTVLKMTTPSGE